MITVYQLAIQNEDDFEVNQGLQNTHFKASFHNCPTTIQAIYSGAVFGLNYEKVADVDTDELEYAFERTNSIDYYWGENEDVKENGSQHRSTSPGDLMLLDGKFFVVASFGFAEIAINDTI